MGKGFVSKYLGGELFIELSSLVRFLEFQTDEIVEDYDAVIFRDYVLHTLKGIALQASLLEQGLPSTSSYKKQED